MLCLLPKMCRRLCPCLRPQSPCDSPPPAPQKTKISCLLRTRASPCGYSKSSGRIRALPWARGAAFSLSRFSCAFQELFAVLLLQEKEQPAPPPLLLPLLLPLSLLFLLYRFRRSYN